MLLRSSITLRQQIKTLPAGIEHPHWSWFPDGEISTDYNCLDRHVKAYVTFILLLPNSELR